MFNSKPRTASVVPEPRHHSSYSPLHWEQVHAELLNQGTTRWPTLNISAHCPGSSCSKSSLGTSTDSLQHQDTPLPLICPIWAGTDLCSHDSSLRRHWATSSGAVLHLHRICPRVCWYVGDPQVLQDAHMLFALGSIIPHRDWYWGNLNTSPCNKDAWTKGKS